MDFMASYGDQKKAVRITESQDGYQVYIDHIYQGNIARIRGEWIPHLNRNSQLDSGDISALIERIEGG
jgi:hypothetical protein